MRQEDPEVTFFGFNITQFKSEIWKFIEFYAHTLAILVVDFFFSAVGARGREGNFSVKYAALNLPLSLWNMMELLAFEVVLVSLLYFV